MQVEHVAIASLSPDPANVRKHNARNLEAIKASLRRFGQQKPIVVDANGIVRAGNGTLEAARALGWDSVAIVRTPLGGSEATAYAIADNRTAELAEWDQLGLAETLRALQSDEGFDLASVGYQDADVDALIESLGDEIIEDGEYPEYAEPDSHSIVLRYRNEDTRTLLRFLGTTDDNVLIEGKAGEKILGRIREIASA